MTSSARFQALQEHFLALADLSLPERELRLNALAQHDASLAAEVRALLAADDDSEGFIEPPAAQAIERIALAGSPDPAPEIDPEDEELAIDSRLGAYRIVRKLAAGGMGVVYLASRADQEFEGFVAIKVQRNAMRSPRTEARLRRERQTLASLTHPHIARLYDGGSTADGRPYLVIEYIEGAPIDRWCREQKLPLKTRLKLLLDVCGAVAHAHRRLVVHRDIKPSNILVNHDGAPRLLDFGIATLLSDTDSNAGGVPTHIAFSPGYAAPEQKRGERVGTTADIYSLGKLLSALLPEDLAPLDRAELEAVITKASAEREEDRYASVESLSQELERFLADLPLEAYPQTTAYRARKFARRHSLALAVAAGGLAGLAAAGGALFAAWHSASSERLQATEARKVAEAARLAADASEQVAATRATESERNAHRYASALGFMNRLFKAPTSRGAGPDLKVIEFLDDARSEIADLPSTQAAVATELHRMLGFAYVGLARFKEGIEQYELALEQRRREFGARHRHAITAQIELGDALCQAGHLERGQVLLEQALIAHQETPESYEDVEHVILLQALMKMHNLKDTPELGMPYATEALQLLVTGEGISAEIHADALAMVAVLEFQSDEDSESALGHLQAAIELIQKEFGAHSPIAQDYRLNLAHYYRKRGEPRRALEIAEAVLASRRHRHPRTHPFLIPPLVAAGRIKSELGQHEEALKYLREAVLIFRDSYGPHSEASTVAKNDLASALRRAGQVQEAETLFLELLSEHEQRSGRLSEGYLATLNSLGVLEESTGRYESAHQRFQAVLEIMTTLRGEHHLDTARAWLNLGTTRFRLQDLEGSSAAMEKAVALRRELMHDAHPSLADALYSWSRTEIARGRFEVARPLLREAADVLLRAESPVASRIARALFDLAFVNEKLNDPEAARSALEEACELARARGAEGHRDLRQGLELLLPLIEAHGTAEELAHCREELSSLPPSPASPGR